MRRSATFPVPGFLIPLLGAGCASPAREVPVPDGSLAARRDSAGIEIVQNTAPRWSERKRWTLSDRPILTIRSTTADERSPLVEPISAFRADDGDYVVADGGFSGFNEILRFSRRGRLRDSFGGSGEGPGEFVQVWWALRYRGDSIAVYDVVSNVSVFSGDGELGRSVRLPQLPTGPSRIGGGTSPWAYGVYPDGSFLAAPAGTADPDGAGPFWFRSLLLRVDADGARWDTLGDYPVAQMSWDGEQVNALPFQLVAQRALRGVELVFGTGARWEIEVRDGAGTLKQIIRRPGNPVAVTESDMVEWREWYLGQVAASPEGGSRAAERARGRLRRVTAPESKPVFSHLLVDAEGNVWSEHYRWAYDGMPPDPQPTAWSVFDPTGQWLGEVVVPERFLLRRVGSDQAIGFYIDEYEARHVQVFALEKP